MSSSSILRLSAGVLSAYLSASCWTSANALASSRANLFLGWGMLASGGCGSSGPTICPNSSRSGEPKRQRCARLPVGTYLNPVSLCSHPLGSYHCDQLSVSFLPIRGRDFALCALAAIRYEPFYTQFRPRRTSPPPRRLGSLPQDRKWTSS